MAVCALQGHLRAEARAAAGDAHLLPAPEQPAALDLGRHHQRLLPHRPQQAAPRPKSAPLSAPPAFIEEFRMPCPFSEPSQPPSLALLPIERSF